MGSLGGYGETRMPDPADRRYVDTKNEPLESSRLRTAMQSASKDDAFLVVAKRMPVRMRFKMDLMKLPLLMVNCANSELPFEIRQVRINAPAGQMGGSYGSMGDSGGRGGPEMGGMGDGGSGMGMGLDGGGDDYGGYGDEGYGSGGYGSGDYGSGSYGMGPRQDMESPYDGTVELYGIVYLYNPVDVNKLGLDETKPDAATPATATGTGSEAGPADGSPAADTTPEAATPAAAAGEATDATAGVGGGGGGGNTPVAAGSE
jgi:hypothetical protein